MPRKTLARRDAIRTAARLFQRQGYHGTGLTQILEESGAPKGSFYFHFPGGKEDLACEAIALASRAIDGLYLKAAQSSRDPSEYVKAIAELLADWLARSDFREGCPVATIALETTPESPRLTASCRAAIHSWQSTTAGYFADVGATPAQARRLATLVVASFEGAFLLARVEENARPFRDIARELATHLEAVLGAR